MRQAGLIPEYGFELDLHAEVFEACAYHRWGLLDKRARLAAGGEDTAEARGYLRPLDDVRGTLV